MYKGGPCVFFCLGINYCFTGLNHCVRMHPLVLCQVNGQKFLKNPASLCGIFKQLMSHIILVFICARRKISTKTVNTLCVVKSIYVFKYKTVRMVNILYIESITPFSFDQCMEGFYAGIVPRVSLR